MINAKFFRLQIHSIQSIYDAAFKIKRLFDYLPLRIAR
jgi:hypothetical protein